MSMKVLPRAKKHHCHRQRCEGGSKDYQNYLVPPSHSKKKLARPHTTRSQHSINEHLPKQSKIQPKSKPSKPSVLERQELSQLRKKNEESLMRNAELVQELQTKSRKINELKQKIRDYEVKLKGSDDRISHLQSIINDSEHPKSPMTYDRSPEYMLASYQQQIKTFQSSQKVMLEHMQKCRMVERQYSQYKNESERKIEKLIRQNEHLRQIQPNEKDYDGEIEQLRKDLLKLSYQQQSPDKTSCVSQNQVAALKASNRQLLAEREHLLLRIQEQAVKEGDLRGNLEAINRKVEKWGQQYTVILDQKKKLEERSRHLQRKLQQKKDRHQSEKEEWARIFRQLMYEVQKLKKQIGRLERSNTKLINIYSEQTE